jgi:Phage integrase family
MSWRIKPAAAAAGFPELTFHDLRHTGASLMISAGCHVKVIAEQMGHSDGGALVLRRYGHLYKGARRRAAIELESHVFDRPKKFGGGDSVGWTAADVGARVRNSLQMGSGRCRARTSDLLRVRQALSQLS